MARARLACLTFVVSSALALSAGPGWASLVEVLPDTTYTLQELIDLPAGEGVLVNDKLFSDFTWVDGSQYGGNAPIPGAITVQGVLVHYNFGDELGLRFTGLWSATGNQLADTVITFTVTVQGPDPIIDNTLWMVNGDAAGGGLASITETVFDASGAEIANKFVYASDVLENKLEHIEYDRPHEVLYIHKDIGANGGGTGVAHISEFYQTFSQVPEPASLLVLCGGALALLRRRK